MTKKMNKILQNPLKSCDFVWISWFWRDFTRILPIFGFCYGFESLDWYNICL